MPHIEASPLVPVVAVHGVSNQDPEKIAQLVIDNLGRSEPPVKALVTAFPWDKFIEHSTWAPDKGGFWRLQSLARSIFRVSRLVITPIQGTIDGALSRIQLGLLVLLKYLVVAIVVTILGYPLFTVVALITGFLFADGEIIPRDEIRWLAETVWPYLVSAIVWFSAATLGLGFLRSLVTKSASRLRATFVSTVLTVLEPLLVLVLSPFVIQWIRAASFLMIVGGFFSLFAFFSSSAAMVTFAIAVCIFIAVIWVLQGIRDLLYRGVSYGLIKIVLDVMRYVGDGRYRKVLLDAFGEHLQEQLTKTKSNDIVILAHSLGSIIALDFLCTRDGLPPTTKVTLITAGSPYRRLFQFFLPMVLFDTDARNDVSRILKRVAVFNWFNVYRPTDLIGGNLKLFKSGIGTDRSTGQWKLNGHTNYWRDGAVRDVILSLLKNSDRHSSPAIGTLPLNELGFPAIREVAPAPSEEQKDRTIQRAVGVMVGMTLAWTGYVIVSNEVTISAERERLLHNGENSPMMYISHSIISVPSGYMGGQSQEIHKFHFFNEGMGPKPKPVRIDPTNPFMPDARRFDYESLMKKIRDNCTPDSSDESTECTSVEPIEYRYLPDDANAYQLPCCPPTFRFFRSVGAVFGIAFTGFWLTVVSSPFLAIIVSVVFILIGRSESEVNRF